jgi:hypothetical protein
VDIRCSEHGECRVTIDDLYARMYEGNLRGWTDQPAELIEFLGDRSRGPPATASDFAGRLPISGKEEPACRA